MKNTFAPIAVSIGLLASACTGSDPSVTASAEETATTPTTATTTTPTQQQEATAGTVVDYTDCLATDLSNPVPADLRTIGDIRPNSDIPGFSKSTTVFGFRLIAPDSIEDGFLHEISAVITSILDPAGNDSAAQDQIITNLYRYGATIPVVPEGFDVDQNLFAGNPQLSVCDIIMKTNRGQVMEVVEHVLHFLTDIGLHATYPDGWGMTDSSALWDSMQEAIGSGVYQVSSYDEIPEPVRQRVQLQEFAYWAISSHWDLQVAYGPNEDEWTARTPVAMEEAVPMAVSLIESTLNGVLSPPSDQSLAALDK